MKVTSKTGSKVNEIICKKLKAVGMNEMQECNVLFLGELPTPKEIIMLKKEQNEG